MFIYYFHLQTRISDWREGALDSRHLIDKLGEADERLKQYEESAAPPGWSCHWDRYCISLVFCQGGVSCLFGLSNRLGVVMNCAQL